MPSTVDPSERILNLVLALINTSVPISRAQIRAKVHGYEGSGSDEAFARLLERDKDTLRSLGVPVVTVGADGPGDEVGYRIDTASYELQDLRLDAAQQAVLGLAAELWRDKALHAQATRGLSKIQALGDPEPGPSSLSDDLVSALSPRVRTGAESYDVIMSAIASRRRVAFSYRAATTGELRDRTVEPWRVAVRAGFWYLVGFDVDRQAPRVFHLARVVGPVRARGPHGAFAAPDPDAVDEATDGLVPTDGGVARLAVLPERAGALRARRVRDDASGDTTLPDLPAHLADALQDRDLITVEYRYLAAFADEVAGYAEAVVVLEPPALRSAVLDRLRAAVALDDLPGGGDRG